MMMMMMMVVEMVGSIFEVKSMWIVVCGKRQGLTSKIRFFL